MKVAKKKINTVKSQKEGNLKAFKIIEKQILSKPNSLIGLAVGKTTDGLHELISKDCKKKPKKWERVKLFQIDENLGIPPSSPLSFNFEIRYELKDLIKIIGKKNIFLMDGGKDPKKTIKEANDFIKKNGGIDLITLGIGPEYDPHIAYNTTGKSSIKSKMRVVKLHPMISKKLSALCKDLPWQVPTGGITLGVKDILDTKKALLLAYGKDKSKSLKLALGKKVDMKKASASALKLHKNLEVILDKDAAEELGQ